MFYVTFNGKLLITDSKATTLTNNVYLEKESKRQNRLLIGNVMHASQVLHIQKYRTWILKIVEL